MSSAHAEEVHTDRKPVGVAPEIEHSDARRFWRSKLWRYLGLALLISGAIGAVMGYQYFEAAKAESIAVSRATLEIDKITATPDHGEAGVEVVFGVKFKTLRVNPLRLAYHWDFGDYTGDNHSVTTHTYQFGRDEPYTVHLTVTSADDPDIHNEAFTRIIVTGSPQPAAAPERSIFRMRNPLGVAQEEAGKLGRALRFTKGGPPAQVLHFGDNYVEFKAGDTRHLLEAPLHARVETLDPSEHDDAFSTWESVGTISAEESAQHVKRTGGLLVSQRFYLVNGPKGITPRTVRVTVTPRSGS